MDDEWNEWTVICIVGCGRPKVDHQTPRFLSKETWTSIKIYDTLCILYNVDIQNDFLPLIYLLYCIVMTYILQSTSQIHYTIRPQYNKQQKRWQNAHVNKISQTWKQNMFWKNVDLLEVFWVVGFPLCQWRMMADSQDWNLSWKVFVTGLVSP